MAYSYSYVRNLNAKAQAELQARQAAAAQQAALPKAVASGASRLYQQRYDEADALLGRLSNQQMQDLRGRYGSLAGQARQGLVSSGLAATTVMPSVMRGIARDESAEINNLNDQLARERLGVMGQYTQGQASAMEGDAARAQQASLSRAQMLQGQNQFASQMSMDLARINAASMAGARSPSRTYGYTSRFTGQVNSHPGSYQSFRSRYARA